jgi:hypothetical protein
METLIKVTTIQNTKILILKLKLKKKIFVLFSNKSNSGDMYGAQI